MTLAIFVVGIIVFGLCVYGAVNYGGLKFTKESLDQEPRLRRQVENEDDLDDGLPTDVKF